MNVSEKINGIEVSQVKGLIEAVRCDGLKGQTSWRAESVWRGGFDCGTTIRQHTLSMDEPNALGGSDSAPNMVEVVLGAYGSCLIVGYTLNASLAGIVIDDLRVEIDGDLDLAGFLDIDPNVPAGFSNITAKVYLRSNADPKRVEELHEKVVRTSPV